MEIIDQETLRSLVGEAEALASAERAFRALAEESVELPPPMGLSIAPVEGEVHVKSAYLVGSPIFAVKVASGFYRNVERGLPSGAGLVLVFDADSGFPLLLLDDGGFLTDLRTAAAGALAARLLAHSTLERVAVLGSGIQARYQLRALRHVRAWERTVAWSRNPKRLETYCAEMERELELPFHAAASAGEALRDADLVITTTASREPLFAGGALAAQATVIAVGSDGPDKRELPAAELARAGKIVVDRLSQCLALGELHHAVEEGAVSVADVHAELGEVLLGVKEGREADELIVCDLTGVGAQDAAIAEVVWERLGRPRTHI